LFYLKVTNMLKTELSEKSNMSTLPDCSVSRQSGYRLGFMNQGSVTETDATTAVVSKYYKDAYFEGRKRRPQERGRKKRRKGKWNPIDRLWNRMNSNDFSSRHLLEQD
jgi:hypothetical protein